MRHTAITLFSSCLFACTLVGGAGGKLGGGGTTASSGGGEGGGEGIADKYSAGVETPRQLMAPEHDAEIIMQYLPDLEKKLSEGTLTNAEDIHSVRVSWLVFFGRMERGGEPRCEPCKNNPKYKELREKAPELNARLAKLEKAVANCTYGYRMSNGDLLPMTLDWSEDEWTKIVDKAQPPGYRQKERCWTDDKDGKEGKPHGWAY
jgi:hypothetical protein